MFWREVVYSKSNEITFIAVISPRNVLNGFPKVG